MPPTMGELMSHTAGFTYGLFGTSPVDKMYQASEPARRSRAARISSTRSRSCRSRIEPGEGWVYSVSVDIQGYLVEKLSGQPFARFMRERIFKPLNMNDTAFFVPADKLSRSRRSIS